MKCWPSRLNRDSRPASCWSGGRSDRGTVGRPPEPAGTGVVPRPLRGFAPVSAASHNHAAMERLPNSVVMPVVAVMASGDRWAPVQRPPEALVVPHPVNGRERGGADRLPSHNVWCGVRILG